MQKTPCPPNNLTPWRSSAPGATAPVNLSHWQKKWVYTHTDIYTLVHAHIQRHTYTQRREEGKLSNTPRGAFRTRRALINQMNYLKIPVGDVQRCACACMEKKVGAVKPQHEMLATAGMCLQYVCMHTKPVRSLCVKVWAYKVNFNFREWDVSQLFSGVVHRWLMHVCVRESEKKGETLYVQDPCISVCRNEKICVCLCVCVHNK